MAKKKVSSKDAAGNGKSVSPIPAGRVQGRENNATISKRLESKSDLLALAMEEGIEYLADNLMDVLETVVSKAKAGNVSCARLILDRVLPPSRTTEQLDGVVNVQINVGESRHAREAIDRQARPEPYERQASAGRTSTDGVTITVSGPEKEHGPH